jgi:hypothetical protein
MNDGLCECDCPDFEARHRGLSTEGCKHIRGLKAAGFLDVPAPVTPKPTVAPITRQDLARARMFGLKLPADAPRAVEVTPPVPVVEPTPARPLDLTNLVVLVVGRYEPVTVFTTALGSAEVRETTEWLAARETAIEVPAAVDVTAYSRFAAFVDEAVNGAPIPIVEVDDQVGEDEASAIQDEAPRFFPTAEMEAEHLGWELGNAGVEAKAPEGWAFSNLVAFYGGWLAGRDALRDETLEYHDWLDALAEEHDRMTEAFGGPEETWAHAELDEVRVGLCVCGHP